MPTPDPNPQTYPPYANQAYVTVHEQDLKGLDGGLYVKTMTDIRHYLDAGTGVWTSTDVYPAGTDWTVDAKYQIWRGNLGLVFVTSKTAPYTSSGSSGFPLAFNTLAEAEAALASTTALPLPQYKFYGRDPKKEIAQTIDAYSANSEEFAAADDLVTQHLTARTVTSANTAYAYYSAKLVNQDSNNQFVLGLSAASGGGQNTTYLANSLSVQQLQEAANACLNMAAGIPIVVPFESPLISDAHASAVEAKNAGEIRDQQIRQTIGSAGGVMRGYDKAVQQNQSWEGASILMGAFGQHGAASQT